jgi:hypothetical protein
MARAIRTLALIAALGVTGQQFAPAQSEKKSEIKGGIEATIKSVDTDKGTVTVTTAEGKERTFHVNDETTIVGPRGGTVRRRLNDPRFHAGLEITVVATGTTASELHLGYNRKEAADASTAGKTTPPRSSSKQTEPDDSKTRSPAAAKAKAGAKAAAKEEDDDQDEEEFPGKVKSADPARHMLVITLLNGKDRSFLVAKDVEFTVKGTKSSKGMEDPALKVGIPVIVVTEPGGRKVKEVQVAPAPAKGKKAG